MKFKKNKFLVDIIFIISCILCTISLVLGDCFLNLPKTPSLRPKFVQKIGSSKVNLLLNDKDERIELFNGQKLDAFCDTKFQSPSYLDTENKIELECNNYGNIYINSDHYGQSAFLECSPLRFNVYELLWNLEWCPPNVTSYILARPKEDSYHYLAGICYDTSNLSFKSLYYTIAPNYVKNLYPAALNSYTTSLKLEHIKETFAKKSINEAHYYSDAMRDWIQFSQYNFSSIIQNSLLINEVNEQLGSFLDLVWWPNLRLGNWKRYEMALAKHVEDQNRTYNILSGISGVAAAPITEPCQTNYTLKDMLSSRYHNIPQFVWNYLQSSSNSSEDIVVIGFNSPFFEYYSADDVLFCPDKCQEIPWLKKVSSSFRYSALGVVFCCSYEDVQLSKRLEGFPEKKLLEFSAFKTKGIEVTEETFTEVDNY